MNAIDPLGLDAVFTFTNGTTASTTTASGFTDLANSAAAANGGISNITINGHADQNSQAFDESQAAADGNASELVQGASGNPWTAVLRSGPTDKGTPIAQILAGKLAKRASIDLQGCSTATGGSNNPNKAGNITQAVSHDIGNNIPVTGSLGPTTYAPIYGPTDQPSGTQTYYNGHK